MPRKPSCKNSVLLALFSWITLASSAWAGCTEPVAELVTVEGTVSRRPAAESIWQSGAAGEGLCRGDYLRVARNSRGTILFRAAETVIRLDQNTTLQILGSQADGDGVAVDIERGIASFLSRVKRFLRIGTPFMNGAIEGTELMVSVGDDFTRLDLYEGEVRVANGDGELRLAGRQSARAGRGEAPRLDTLVNPGDAVQWSLHYEPVLAALLSSRRDDAPAALIQLFRAALSELRGGGAAAAFTRLSAQAPARRDADFHTFRAALFLTVGRVDSAEADLAAAQRLQPGDPAARAIASVIALSRNDRDRAMRLAEEATTAADQSLTWLALSYARQAHFDLEGAEAAVARGLRVDPDNGLLQARRAELLLALGDFDAALAAARAAQAAAPDVALAWRALGFAELLRLRVAEARQAFYRAVVLDQGDPLTWLGLGLALIRQGELAAGREHLEVAVALGPRRSLLRSYLGKAYYEEKRDGLAATQYELAAELDPRDPTPWLYRAILLQQHNRPGEALEALERSIGLNDNRAVYRSRLQLDADAAARSASLGRTYRDLGFEQLALLQGWRSSATAPDDYSGHRLLADVYGVLPRHEEARVSELLQAQLLQPLNASPVQPVMAETRLLVPDGLAPAAPGLNEYSGLFSRDGGNAWVSATVGDHQALGDEILASGLSGRTAFSVGQYHYDLQGGGAVVPQRQDILVGFMQQQLAPGTSVQAEVRYSDRDKGPYERASLSGVPTRDEEEARSGRLGLTHRWSPESVLLGSLIFQSADLRTVGSGRYLTSDPASLLEADGVGSDEGWSAELRQDWRRPGLRVSAGIGYFDLDQVHELSSTAEFSGDVEGLPGIFSFASTLDETSESRFFQVYTYASWDLTAHWEVDFGLSYDRLRETVDTRETTASGFEVSGPESLQIPLDSGQTAQRGSDTTARLNPKLGLVWRPSPDTTLRAAAFRSLRRPEILRRTIEPTQVAGFNQMFDGHQGESFWRYGIGIDHRLFPGLSAGAELSRRERRIPEVVVGEGTDESHRNERFGRAYLYWAPVARWSAAAEYFYERQVVGDASVDDVTHRLPLSLAYFHPAGPYGRLQGSYVEQSGSWSQAAGSRQRETFWNWDFEFGYRLPKRRGLISLQVNNLFDRRFDFQETDENHPLFVGERTLSLRASLRF